jgi:hypothetical protein
MFYTDYCRVEGPAGAFLPLSKVIAECEQEPSEMQAWHLQSPVSFINKKILSHRAKDAISLNSLRDLYSV